MARNKYFDFQLHIFLFELAAIRVTGSPIKREIVTASGVQDKARSFAREIPIGPIDASGWLIIMVLSCW